MTTIGRASSAWGEEDMDTCASVLDPEQPRLYYAHNFVMVLSTSSEHHYITSALYNADTLRDGGVAAQSPSSS
jgi:hypothetical protein